ncbi:hypothetical protein [Kineosporia sp. NBRC 101731]|uniref:hypothetical protein n=1 Tax=Kineosporia sp. NBRC 101731 TaxID=3032199 RepID=UPI0024A0EA2D|nr:hypothetical protein [Kineosporia sp. NBRC 101731]GLY29194.1 hypothetical protein Kisp02_25590 [Kineosporia sp. NBRC 101731]
MRPDLRQGLTVIAESVNPLAITRQAWRDIAGRARVPALEAEIICSDATQHRHRAEHRHVDIPDLVPPDWDAITGRDYEPWDRAHLVIDTASRDVATCVAELRQAVEAETGPVTDRPH